MPGRLSRLLVPLLLVILSFALIALIAAITMSLFIPVS
jgi:hypothetical protein